MLLVVGLLLAATVVAEEPSVEEAVPCGLPLVGLLSPAPSLEQPALVVLLPVVAWAAVVAP